MLKDLTSSKQEIWKLTKIVWPSLGQVTVHFPKFMVELLYAGNIITGIKKFKI